MDRKQAFNLTRLTSTWFTFLVSIYLLTPVCGWLFGCGCTWPHEGLADHCNYFDAQNTESCPWCEHLFIGVFCSVVAVYLGVTISQFRIRKTLWFEDGRIKSDGKLWVLDGLLDTLLGISGFLLTAAILGGLTAAWYGYKFNL